MLISICIATCQRPQGLMRLLESLRRLTFERVASPAIEIIVIENDDSGVALNLCDKLKDTYPWTLRYASEPQRGISYARNRGVSMVSPEADFIVFVDDDEIVEPDWLDELLTIQSICQADVVNGPVLSTFDNPVPPWIHQGQFFERKRYPTGTAIKTANTGNVLVRATLLRNLDPVFDERFTLTGGEDHHLFTRLHRQGCKLVYNNQAIAHEIVPAHRITVQYLLQRSFRSGNSITLCELDFQPLKIRILRTMKGVGRMLQGVCALPFSLGQERHLQVKALSYLFYGLGMLAAVVGYRYEIYRPATPVSPAPAPIALPLSPPFSTSESSSPIP